MVTIGKTIVAFSVPWFKITTQGAGDVAWFAKNPSDFVGTFDESFAGLSNTKKVDLAFIEIEKAFGKNYAEEIRELYESTNCKKDSKCLQMKRT